MLVTGIVSAGSILIFLHTRSHDRIVFSPKEITLPADGALHIAFHLSRLSRRNLPLGELQANSASVHLYQGRENEIEGQVQSPVLPGSSRLQVSWRGHAVTVSVSFVPDFSDSFQDGTPDFLRLHAAEDRRAFRMWFAALADAQADLPKEKLPIEIDDCAALLRFAYREALHGHDENWLAEQHLGPVAPFASVRQYKYPDTPLGAALYRVKSGAFTADDLKDGSFAQFADAKTLMQRNTYFVSRNIHAARLGDVIFFRQLEQNSPYHSMIVTAQDAEWVVYHTGPIGKAKGEVRRVSMEDLLHHPDRRWRPVPENSNFLGVYRWNILRDGD